MTLNLFYTGIALSVLYLVISVFYIVYFITNRQFFRKTERILLWFNLLFHAYYLVATGMAVRKIPLNSMFEAMAVLAFLVAVLYMLMRFLVKAEALGLFVFPLIFTFQAIATIGTKIIYLNEELFRSPLFFFHTLTTLMGYVGFVYSMVLGVMYLQLFRELKRKKIRMMFDRLPPLELMERLNGTSQLVGFIFLSFGIGSGTVMALQVWGELPIFDPKILLSFLLWVLYLFSILIRALSDWSGRKMSYISLVGFAIMVFTIMVVRLVFTTLHNY
jgi:ABC-type uncharacterized transport system permease subunit